MRSNISLDVCRSKKEEGANNEEGENVWRLPLIRGVRRINDGECEENQSAYNQYRAKPIHFDFGWGISFFENVGGHSEVSCESSDC